MRRGVFQVRHFRGRNDSGDLDETRHIFVDIAAVENDIAGNCSL
jgi:hypothetical protein